MCIHVLKITSCLQKSIDNVGHPFSSAATSFPHHEDELAGSRSEGGTESSSRSSIHEYIPPSPAFMDPSSEYSEARNSEVKHRPAKSSDEAASPDGFPIR